MGQAVSDEPDFDSLILQALRGDPGAVARLFKPAQRYARRLVTARAPDLPEDLRDDVFQEALELVLRAKPGDYDPTRGTPKQFFRLLLMNAIRRVRVGFTPPGQVTRQRAKPKPAKDHRENGIKFAASTLSFDEIAATADDPASLDPFAAIEARIDAPKVLAAAPPLVAEALRLIHLQQVPTQEAARMLELSRFALRREILGFAPSWRAAA